MYLGLPKGSFSNLWPPINCLCLREKGTKFGLNYPAVRLCVADYLCPYHSVVGSIYDPAHYSMKKNVYPLYDTNVGLREKIHVFARNST